MLRALIRNVMLALTVGLPILITAGATIAWIFPPAWAGREGFPFSISGFAGGFLFWYIILALPVAIYALVHNLALILLAREGRRSVSRAHSIVLAIAMSLCVAFAVSVGATQFNWPVLLGTLLFASIAYGSIIQLQALSGRSGDAAG